MRLGELIYSDSDKRNPSFKDLFLTRWDAKVSESHQYATLRLKRSKTDLNHTGVFIVLAATRTETCPVDALHWLFTQDPQPPNPPFFSYNNPFFNRRRVVEQLRSRIFTVGISSTNYNYSGHSFRKGAAQHAADNGMLEDIRKLGRWNGESFRLYYTTSLYTLYNLDMNFQTGRSVALSRAWPTECSFSGHTLFEQSFKLHRLRSSDVLPLRANWSKAY